VAEIKAVDPVEVCAKYGDEPSALIEILHDIQAASGAVSEPDLRAVAETLNLSRAEVHGVMSFYHDFRREPAGHTVIRICRAESCQAMGAFDLIKTICERHGIELGQTSSDGVTVQAVYCLGNCALSPAASVNGTLIGRADDEAIIRATTKSISEARP